MLYVSELAALIGHNKYKTPQEAMIALWKRLHPDDFQRVCNLAQKQVHDDEQVAQTFQVNVRQLSTVANERAATQQLAQHMSSTPLLKADPKTIQRVKTIVQSNQSQAQKIQTLTKLVQADQQISKQAATQLEKAAVQMVQVGAIDDASIAQLVETVKLQDCQTIAKQISSAVSKARGTRHESNAIAMYEAQTGQIVEENNETFYKTNLGTVTNPVWIGGRIDGLTPTKLVEVKCRRNRFFQWLPAYEKVQISAYMVMTGRYECDLVQKFNNQIRVATHKFDPDYWASISLQVVDVWHQFQNIMNSDASKLELLSCT